MPTVERLGAIPRLRRDRNKFRDDADYSCMFHRGSGQWRLAALLMVEGLVEGYCNLRQEKAAARRR